MKLTASFAHSMRRAIIAQVVQHDVMSPKFHKCSECWIIDGNFAELRAMPRSISEYVVAMTRTRSVCCGLRSAF